MALLQYPRDAIERGMKNSREHGTHLKQMPEWKDLLEKHQRYRLILSVLLIFCLVVWGCDAQEHEPEVRSTSTRIPAETAYPENVERTGEKGDKALSAYQLPKIVAFGNSLTAGLGVTPDQSYPGQLERRLQEAGYRYQVINAGVSGETTAGGVRRVDWVLKSDPAIVILELGANDALRGQSLEQSHANLKSIIAKFQAERVKVILAGMKIPLNYGETYTRQFEVMYQKLADEMQVPLIPFFLRGVAADRHLNQGDGIHPTEDGYKLVVDNVWETLMPLLKRRGIEN